MPSGTPTPSRFPAARPDAITTQVYGPDFPYDGFVARFRRSLGPGRPLRPGRRLPAGRGPLRGTHHQAPRRLLPVAHRPRPSGQGRLPLAPGPGGGPDHGRAGPGHAHGPLLLGRIRLALQRAWSCGDWATSSWPFPPDAGYARYVEGHVRELIDRYRPSVLWNDIGWPTAGHLPTLFADYYNTVEDGVVNDRWLQSSRRGPLVDARRARGGRRRPRGVAPGARPLQTADLPRRPPR